MKHTLNILSIDDDPGCQLAAARFLTLIGGHKVETACDGETGLRKAAALRPDVILMDLRMPGMDGWQVMDELLSAPSTREIPVIILTGAEISGEETASMTRRSNFLAFFQKPAKLSIVLDRIEAHFSCSPALRQGVETESYWRRP